MRLPILLAALCLIGAPAFCDAPSTPALPINLDGKLDDALWSRSEPITDFVIQPNKAPLAKTTAWLATDETFLYLSARCEEPKMELLASYEYPRDGNIWRNDCIEVFIAPAKAQGEYFHIVMDAAGQIYDAWVQEKNRAVVFDLPVAVATSRGESAWTLEAAIPLADLRLTKNQVPRICIGRERKTVFEFSAWNGWFNQPAKWQPVEVAVPPQYSIEVKSLDFGERKYGINTFDLQFASGTTGKISVEREIQENGVWKIAETREVNVVANQPQHVAWDYTLSPDKEYSGVGFRAVADGYVISSARCRIELPRAAVSVRLPTPYLFNDEKSSRGKLTTALSERSLRDHSVRIFIKNPAGKVLSTRRIAPLENGAILLADFSGWKTGDGSLEVQLVNAQGQIAARQIIIVTKRPGPFS